MARELSDEEVFGSSSVEMSDDEVFGKAAKPAPKPKATPKPKRSAGEAVGGFMANLNRGLGVGDEVAAGLSTVEGLVSGRHRIGADKPGNIFANNAAMVRDAYMTELAGKRRTEDEFAATNPKTAALARGTGMAATVAVPTTPIVTGSRVLGAAKGATTAAATGAVYAAADRGSASERIDAARRTAVNPFVLGLGALGGAAVAPRVVKTKVTPPKLTLDDLKAQKNAAYKAVDKSGVAYTPQAYDDLVSNIEREVADANISATRHPKAASMVADMRQRAKAGNAPTLTQLDQLRQEIRRDVANPKFDDAEQFFGRKIIAQLDAFIDGAGGSQMAAGVGSDGASLIKSARDLNTRSRKVEAVTDAVESARHRAGSTGSGGNVDNATRQNLRRVLEDTPNLSAEESAALESIVMGGKGQNLLRQVGKLSPSGNGLMAAGNLGAAAMAGPLGAIPGAAGLIAKLAADGLTRSKVERLVQLMAQGGAKRAPTIITRPGVTLPAAAAGKVSRAAGVSGAARTHTAP